MHQSALLDELMAALAVREQGIYVDCTFGRGGHARALLQKLGATGRLLALDRDPEAIIAARDIQGDPRFEIVKAPFSALPALTQARNIWGKIDGIMLDLGVSSPQLDDPARGFSFMRDGSLDMRMDPESGITAEQWLAHASETEITQCLWRFGEEPHARRIARAIVERRAAKPFSGTCDLAALIAATVPTSGRGKGRTQGRQIHPATRAFQAIRILVNREMEELDAVLQHSIAALGAGGRLAVISFHSLEDQRVKRFMRTAARGDPVPIEVPLKARDLNPSLRIVGKLIRPTERECAANPRVRSARLRIAEKLS